MFSGVVCSYVSPGYVVTCLSVIAVTSLAASSPLRIIGGRDANDEELSYVIRLQYQVTISAEDMKILRYSHICTCSALTCEWSLTARHCVDEPVFDFATMTTKHKLPKNTTVKLVVGYTSGEPSTPRVTYVLNAVFPKARKTEIIIDDVALMRTEPLRLQTFAKLSALDFDTLLYQEVLAVGYGLTNHTHLYSKLYNTLELGRPLQISKAMLSSCGDSDENVFPDMCLRHKCGQSSTLCSGDSGGPVIHRSGIVAVNSRAHAQSNCHMKSDILRKPIVGIVTAISPYLDWITSIIN